MVAALVSRMDSMTNLPDESITDDHDGCLMNVQPNILFTVHEGAPFVGGVLNHHNLLQKGAFL
jgi:hypothetical protein